MRRSVASLTSLIAAALLALPSLATAQDEPVDQPESGPCCTAAAVEGRVCNHSAVGLPALAELPVLGAEATAKERRLREIHERAAMSVNPLLGRAGLEQARLALEAADPLVDAHGAMGARWAYAHYLMGAGDVAGAVEQFEALHEELDVREDSTSEMRAEVLYQLGLAWFRLAERRNCVAHHNQESCIFPLAGGAVHVDREGAEHARAAFLRVLAIDPRRVEARWLLNVAHMALGTWPADVPEAQRIPPERFAPEHVLGRFVDVAPALGLNRLTRAGGAVLDDFDGDGWLDVLTSTMDTGQSLRLFKNLGTGAFADVTASAGLSRQLGGVALAHGDLDGDGWLDVLVLRGGELGSEGEMPCSLLRQSAPGVFADVTAAVGLEREAPARAAALADVDRDGDLDLFIGYETETYGPRRYPSRLLRNEEGASFTDVTRAVGIQDGGACAGAAFGDVDGDGWPELYVSNRNAKNQLWMNRAGTRFEESAARLGVAEPRNSRAAWFFDYDNDGDLDLLATQHGYAQAERAVAEWYLSGQVGAEIPRLYENDGRGAFRDVSVERGLGRAIYALSANSGDVDGDGWQDLYFGTGALEMSALWPNVLLRNDRGKRFQDATSAAGLGHLQKGQSIAFGDVDADGDEDVLLQAGGYLPDDAFWDALFENPGHESRWLTVRLAGAGRNRFGVGARVRARIVEAGAERDVFAFAGATSSTGGNSLQLELGLGRAERVVELEVRWPLGAVQRFADVPLDRTVRITEGAPALEVLALAPLPLARPARIQAEPGRKPGAD